MPTQRARRCPERPIHPKHGTERRRRLETLDDVDTIEHLARHGMVAFAGIPGTRHITQFWNWNKAQRQFGVGERDG